MVARRAIQCHAPGLLPLCLSALSYRLIRMSGSSAYGACFSSCVGRGQHTPVKIAIRSYPPPFIRSVRKRVQEAYSLPAAGILYSRVSCARTLLFRRIFGQCANAPCSPGVFFGNVRAHSAFPERFRPMCKCTLLCRGGARLVRAFREPAGSYAASTAEKTRVARKLYETIICKEDEVWQR